MAGLNQHETCSLIGQIGLNLITSQSEFCFLWLHHMTGLLFYHAATSWALPHGTNQNCLLRYRPSQKAEGGGAGCGSFCECVHTCVCVSCLEQ